ncbi:hypothetical protein OB2597_18152 [Pseudooceanicola batsensis HTCC2597]|uniref:Uncharacterized protein n=1 Tax=Pseudooceanicola batsensis (strain ATCC BAA-863 / DSM 15984 / KCTC 12145 / HTCC2597) TaxID=252305 RepID=A3U034_PSEBH|nr:hypothetical protein [Pseudooceanicola batsensis]EAQ02665.1 hypothetical protein OB2597_18152 [Pseudooceanicola batsensis HTCC2597]
MTLEDIKAAVDGGETVHWANEGYQVIKDRLGQYLIVFLGNGSAIGLTDRSGQRLNGREAVFFVSRAAEGPAAGQDGRARLDSATSPRTAPQPDGQG